VALHADETVHVDLLRRTRSLCPLEGQHQHSPRAGRHGHQIGIFVQERLHLFTLLGRKALQIVVILRAVEIGHRIDRVGRIFRHVNRIVGKVLRNVEIRRVIDVLGRADNEFVIPLELAEQYAPAVRIEPVHVFVVPDLLSSEGRSTPLLEDDLMDAVTREKVALALPPLDRHGREIEIDDHLLQTRTRLEVNLQHFGLTVRIDDVIVFTKDGRYVITKVSDKAFFDKNIYYIGVFKRNDERTIYNVLYRDGKNGPILMKRCAIKGITRDKEYNITKGDPKSEILYMSVNPNGEAQMF
jgi:hypothetical protein